MKKIRQPLCIMLCACAILFIPLIFIAYTIYFNIPDAMFNQSMDTQTLPPLSMATYPMFPSFGDEIYYFERNQDDIFINYSSVNLNKWMELTPGWEGIIPGESNYLEAARTISDNKLFYQVVIYEPVSGAIKNYQLSFRWIERQSQSTIIPKFGDALFNRESGINTCVRITIQQIKLSELFTVIGEPSHITIYGASSIDSGGEFTWQIQLVYMEKGIMFSKPLVQSNVIVSDLEVNKVVFFQPTKEGFKNATSEGEQQDLQPWTGYGRYKEK